MKLTLRHLAKAYLPGDYVVTDISLDIQGPAIVGLLGPNGAGKTTTIRMISGYLAPTRGKVLFDELDVWKNLILAKRMMGYMPERLAIYPELSVGEFLWMRALLKNIPFRKISKEVARVIELADIGDVKDRLVASLSKGYIQRVGLADALIGRPKLLILDEPTIGLDPNQILKFRQVVKEVGKEALVLFSTHILSEVEAVCRDVIILHKGKVVAFGKKEEIIHSGKRLVVEVKLDEKDEKIDMISWIGELASLVTQVVETKKMEDDWVYLLLELDEDRREDIFDVIVRSRVKLRRMEWVGVKLEEVFSALTMGDEK